MTITAHTPGPWRVFDVFKDLEIVSDRATAHETESIVQFKGQCNAKANARLMAAAPQLLKALQTSEQAIEEATDILHFEDRQPVTALEGWEIERAYTALCSALVEVHQAIAVARGHEP
jgi:hypothetical protein